MLPYYLVLVSALIYISSAKGENRNNPRAFAVFMTGLAFFVGLGDMIGGYDRYIYAELFDDVADCMKKGYLFDAAIFQSYLRELGYCFWNVLVALITSNRYIFIFLTTLLIYGLIFRAIMKYTTNYPVATIAFLGLFYYFTMTYLRQAIAVGIVWNAINYIWERKILKYFLMVFLAGMFHNSAFIAMIAYFVSYRYIPQHRVVMILIVSFVLAFSPLANILLALSGDVMENEARASVLSTQDQGFRIDYVLEVIVFMYIFIKNKNYIPRDKVTMTFVNISYIFCASLMIFMRFGQGGRLGWFFMIGFIYCFSFFTSFNKRTDDIKLIVISVCIALFVRLTYVWVPMLDSYKTFLTNGEPSGKIVYQKFEYDVLYTRDKFYR